MKTHPQKLAMMLLALTITGAPVLSADEPKTPDSPTTRPTGDAESAVAKITLPEFDKLRTDKDVVVLDVRTPKEFAAGHVPGAVNIDWHSRGFAEQVEKLDKTKKYLTYCHAGTRSAAATRKMATMGFTNLSDFSGGWSAYEKAGKPVEK